MKISLQFSESRTSQSSLPVLCFAVASFIAGISLCLGFLFQEPCAFQITQAANFLGIITFFLYVNRSSFFRQRPVVLSLLFCFWFLFLKFLSSGLFSPVIPAEPRFQDYPFLFDFLIFLPFAVWDPSRENLTGLKILGFFYIVGTMVIVISTLMLCYGCLPITLSDMVSWGIDFRLYAFWNPNLSAGILMNTVFFLLIFIFTTKSIYIKVLNILILLSVLFTLSATDTTTVFIMLSVMLGGVISFSLLRNHLEKRPVLRWFTLITVGIFFCILTLLIFTSAYRLLQLHVIAPALGLSIEDILKHNQLRSNSSRLFSFSGRAQLWIQFLREPIKDPSVWLLGIPNLTEAFHIDTGDLYHAHNYLIECFMGMGVVGFGLCIYTSYLALKNSFILIFVKKTPFVQKIVSMYICCVMGTQFFESFLLCVPYPRNYINVVFLLCMGYQFYWVQETERTDPSYI